jgi:thiol-disulfide isomerase/thioredoxin
MRLAASISIITCVLGAAAIVWAIPPMPRKSPEFTILEPSLTGGPDKLSLLSSHRGKVILLAFIHTTCPHCQAYSELLTKLHKELGPRGFQPIAIAWDPNAKMLVPGFIKQHKIDFPVGYSEVYDPIMNFLGFSVMDRPRIPLEAVIDRKGMIRAESPPETDPDLQDENFLRTLITNLLNEPAPAKK